MNVQTNMIASENGRLRAPRFAGWRAVAFGAGAILLAVCAALLFLVVDPARTPTFLVPMMEDWTGSNPRPVALVRPVERPLSALARIGEKMFRDRSLSASGTQSCASCHDAARGYGPPNALDVQLGGADKTREGLRPPPSLAYLYRQDGFGIGPSIAEQDDVIPLDQLAQQGQAAPRVTKTAGTNTLATLVPRGGLFWDGRVNMLMDQARGPLVDPAEMANKDIATVIEKLRKAPYIQDLVPLFGATVLDRPGMLFTEAMSALSAYQVEHGGFHRFDSKYDHWLEGKARFTHAEMRGLRLFNDPAKGNCAACHLSQPSKDGLPPLFTDTEYEALGVPRNTRLAVNRDPGFFDMGLCGPLRKDLAEQTQYCGMFLTPTLRNSARRGVYFHNGVYHDLKQVLDFYNLRDVHPERIYPRDASGRVVKYDDLPTRLHANIDTADAPFDRKPGDRPALTDGEIGDIIAFLHTLDDGDAGSGY